MSNNSLCHKLLRYTAFLLLSVVVLSPLAVSFAGTGSQKNDINAKAARNKALRYIEDAHAISSNAFLPSIILIDRAYELMPGDTDVQLAYNDYDLILHNDSNPTYHKQLDLIRQAKSPAYYYYTTLFNSTPPDADTDTTYAFRTALQAYRQFPADAIFRDNALKTGVDVLSAWCYGNDDSVDITDTLHLSPGQLALADTLRVLADEIERFTGYNESIDRTRAVLAITTKDNDAMQKLVRSLEAREDKDESTLDLLANIYQYQQDTLKCYDTYRQLFESNPTGGFLMQLFGSGPVDSLAQKTIALAYRFIDDKDNEAEARFDVLSELTAAYINYLGEVPDNDSVLMRFNSSFSDIIAEDPLHTVDYARAAVITDNMNEWTTKYGYSHWVDMFANTPDSINDIIQLTAIIGNMLPPKQDINAGYENLLNKIDRDSSSYLSLLSVYAQYLYQSEQYNKVLEMLEPVTMDTMLDWANMLRSEYQERVASGQAELPAMSNEELADAIAEYKDALGSSNPVRKWIAVKEMISQSYAMLEDYPNAIAPLRLIELVDPANPEILNNLAFFMGEEGSDLDEALRIVSRAILYEPQNANALDTRAWILYKKGDYEAALPDMKSILQIAGEPFIGKVNLPSDDFFEILRSEDDYMTTILALINIFGSNSQVFLEHLVEIMVPMGEEYKPAIMHSLIGISIMDKDNAVLQKYKDSYGIGLSSDDHNDDPEQSETQTPETTE